MDHQQKDETAVAYLATAMNTKLARARAKGRSGWDSPECTQQHLSNLLREHVEKGDPVDVANFCAFLAARGEGIAPRQCLAQIEEPAGAAPAAVAGPAPKGWRLVPATPTRDWIAAVADGGYEDCDCASLIADILSRAPAAPALEAPAATIQHHGMTIAGNGAAELGKLMREQWETRGGVYPDGNPNSGQP
ncbi:hypothetical protein N5K37_14630 [Delftia tsuruhatensis]|uniref:Uncharacterized protein n=1 Tax=Delftia tsuruhatensis TaxID=180282 RepID=A0ABM6EE04_9BURK|nr:hypothetical protein [Delftia tsuruhatensis]AOV05690.1 hypothetical protein BI380_32460 [Delftia tsuruhatensis]MDH2231146.1 hypothetical protein [Delftia tsuruhatensis]